MEKLTREIMWEAVINNNQRYDGIFYYAVKSTGIFCRPSCKSKIPRFENVLFFGTAHEALTEGYRPCKRCRPDVIDTYHESIKEISQIVVNILQTEYQNPTILNELPSRVGLSPFHLQRSFKKHIGQTPKVFLQNIRIRQAKKLLETKEMNNTEICFAVGFDSLSSFYAVFRKMTGLSPKDYQFKLNR